MRSTRLMATLISISLICVLCVNSVSALESNEITVALYWERQVLYQGDTATVRISLKTTSTEQLFIYYIGIHFDWMPEGGFYGYDLSKSPVLIPSGGSYIFDPISIQIPINVSVGEHSYFVGIEGRQGSTTTFSWDSPPSTVRIHPFGYAIMLSQIERELNESIHANYESAEARSLLQQAQREFAKAHPLAIEGNWQEALPHLYNASDLLTQAREIEQLNAEQKATQQTLLLYGVIITVVVVVVAAVIVLTVRKKRKRLASEATQPSETTEEFSAEQT
ncbi:MAG: hypothetical protein ACPLKZ_03280 [Candidatus Bathyarchaeales archaeon]